LVVEEDRGVIRSHLVALWLVVLLAPLNSRPAHADDDSARSVRGFRIPAVTMPTPHSLRGSLTWRHAIAQTTGPSHPSRPNWMKRHPVLFGALVGAGAGAIFGLISENELICSGGDEDCLFYGAKRPLVGAGLGAGTGALVGLTLGR
jgi:hypothetical protein